MIHFGPAGWMYKDWEGIVYPKPKPKGFDPLEYLARYFNTIEINSTFYGSPLPSTADKWVARVGDSPDFRFTAKLWKRFTHERKSAWTRTEVKEACVPMDRMHRAGKLGALLLQFPWSFRRTDENREWLDDVTRAFRQFPLVLEVRHERVDLPRSGGGITQVANHHDRPIIVRLPPGWRPASRRAAKARPRGRRGQFPRLAPRSRHGAQRINA